MTNRPRVFIEEQFPIEELGIESRRENSTGQHPPVNRLHVWWARRPLTVSRAAVLGSILPADFNPEEFKKILGMQKDPKIGMRKIMAAKESGVRISDPYGYPRAFTYNPFEHFHTTLKENYKSIWGTEAPTVLDPMAGGGSIPFEAYRLGLNVIASELNPVAHIIERATMEFPIKFGLSLAKDIENWANTVHKRAKIDLEKFFPKRGAGDIFCYLWARTVICPNHHCGISVPLSPNWWLEKKGDEKRNLHGVAVRIKNITNCKCEFEILKINKGDVLEMYDPGDGTVSWGNGECPNPNCGSSIPSNYIKSEAIAGRMGQQLYAVGIQVPKPGSLRAKMKTYRNPESGEEEANEQAYQYLMEKWDNWDEKGWIPTETVIEGTKTREMLTRGMNKWFKIFSPRQLLSHLTYLEKIMEVKKEIKNEMNEDRQKAVITYLALIFDKCVDYGSILMKWDGTRKKLCNTFDRHDFSFKWSFGERNIVADGLGFDWPVKKVIDSYKSIQKLIGKGKSLNIERANSMRLSYSNLDIIVVDPPYYDNVMYSELSDFFYVWQKRILGDIYPDVFQNTLTNKEDEAVANNARFKGMGKSARQLAKEDYERKMAKCFSEMHKALRDEGVLTVMFTHKTTEAWDTLATALMEGGFEITASWPVHTESEHSLHQAKKNAAKSTIIIVCRKRLEEAEEAWWEDDILPEVQKVAEQKAEIFEKRGIRGVDLYISTFGPVLEVFSRHYPVRNMSNDIVRPQEALDAARKVVTERSFRKIVKEGARGIDPETRFYILGWHFYRAKKFPYDEARRLAIAVGTDVDDLKAKHLAVKVKSSDYIELLTAKDREKKGYIDPDKPDHKGMLINAIHLAELVYGMGGDASLKELVKTLRLDINKDFDTALEALFESLPDATDEKKMLAPMLLGDVTQVVEKGGKITDWS